MPPDALNNTDGDILRINLYENTEGSGKISKVLRRMVRRIAHSDSFQDIYDHLIRAHEQRKKQNVDAVTSSPDTPTPPPKVTPPLLQPSNEYLLLKRGSVDSAIINSCEISKRKMLARIFKLPSKESHESLSKELQDSIPKESYLTGRRSSDWFLRHRQRSSSLNCLSSSSTEDLSNPVGPPMNMLERLAVNSLHLGAPACSLLIQERRKSWVQLSGHPGSLAPAGPGTIWKKRGVDPHETEVYRALMNDSARSIVPTFFRELQYDTDYFIEMQDLLFTFKKPSLMDIKMGVRTFLESEVTNTKPRQDLYEKMISVCPEEPTHEEHISKSVTKRRYMEFREQLSSSRELGFRIEGMRVHGSPPFKDLKKIRSREDISNLLAKFVRQKDSIRNRILERLVHIRKSFENSPFFQRHEVIGASILLIYDEEKAGAWLIDFAKTRPLPEGVAIDHRSPWVLGNHEEGFLTGIDNIIHVFEQVKLPKNRRLSLFSHK